MFFPSVHPSLFPERFRLDIFHAVVEVDRTRQAVHAKMSPVPELEGEDILGCADLQHHRIFPEQCTVPAGIST